MDVKRDSAQALLSWYQSAKRDLPWRQSHDPYHIWVSEIMLQQTRVESVKGYYARFLASFPTLLHLAAAPEEQVLKAWEGLGYYSRARNLHKAAKTVAFELNGSFPDTYEKILALSGIGPYTAGAIASIVFSQRVPAIDGNVLRVASRFFGVREDIGAPQTQRKLRQLVTESLPDENVRDYNQALMELGATVCVPRAPKCDFCPWQAACDAYAEHDAELLPVHEKKRPPKPVDVAVCLLTFQDQILVMRRSERMLQGMYVFTLVEEEVRISPVQALLEEQGLPCAFAADCGAARHVFTHRVWEMRILHFTLAKPPDAALLSALQARLVNREGLLSLPLPAAMRAAKEKALTLL